MDKKIFLSYCQKNENEAKAIDTAFLEKGIKLTKDERDLKYKQSLKEFMEGIREHDYAILLISYEYLTSLNCMYEFLQVLKEKDFENKMLPLILVHNFYDSNCRVKYSEYWKNEVEKFEKEMEKLSTKKMWSSIGNKNEELKKYKKIELEIDSIINELQERKMLNFYDEQKNDFSTIFKELGVKTQKETEKIVEDWVEKGAIIKGDVYALFPELNNKKLEEESQSKTNIGMPKEDISFLSRNSNNIIKSTKKKGSFSLTENGILDEIFDSTRKDWNKEVYRDFFTYKHNILLTIEEKEESEREFFEPWANCHPDKRAYFYEYEIKYNKIRVTSIYLVAVDGGRAYIPLPEKGTKTIKDKYVKFANIIHSYPENINYEYINRSGLKIDYDN
ncbi:toll/interleukin-1 receptor domain-containing protein [Fusobacterium sp.]|uniref:toll/interleukin-1 receptor domain-containing protein n=1 Tax=Fusobacterium sp. TaxID=68766 RepID=UPI002603E50A|nr:toll/interleukin-1 receptor domain-containing protein [Fusobacterium sp.]